MRILFASWVLYLRKQVIEGVDVPNDRVFQTFQGVEPVGFD